MTFAHVPVLAQEVLRCMAPRPGGVYVDGTLGGGGHAELILDAAGSGARLIGCDRDAAALDAAGERLKRFAGQVTLIHDNFAAVRANLDRLGIATVDGVLLDLGVSSHQLDTAERGFSFQADAPLDMRMDQAAGVTAADLVNSESEGELAELIRKFGEERWARRIARQIVIARDETPILTTGQLVALIDRAIPRGAREERLHPATRTFQALRIAVNGELDSLAQFLDDATSLLSPGGRLVIISFHSLEDRMVKERFRDFAGRCTCPRGLPQCRCGARAVMQVLTSRPLVATVAEMAENPRARSAKLRAAERLAAEARG